LVAVSKTKPESDIILAYNTGHRDFGENKVQELLNKYENLPKDIKWHMIGHLQKNKVKYIAPFISLIHSVDSLDLLKVINKEAIKNNRTINCLLQIKIAREDSKFGLTQKDTLDLLSSEEFNTLEHIHIIGIMGMATFTSDIEIIEKEYKNIYGIFIEIRDEFFKEKTYFRELSIGMSGDYHIAIKYNATMVRLGSNIFGERT
jgi:pyridoxal phosphate enzyme (YggS family)